MKKYYNTPIAEVIQIKAYEFMALSKGEIDLSEEVNASGVDIRRRMWMEDEEDEW